MRFSLAWMGGLALGCALETKLVGETLDEGAAEESGESGSLPAGDGCDADDCAPELLWVHGRSQNSSRGVVVDASGRPLWLEPDGVDLYAVRYDPATDVEAVVAGPFGLGTEWGVPGVAADGSLRVLTWPFDDERSLLRVDGTEVVWTLPIPGGELEPKIEELAVGPDGTAYLSGASSSGVRVVAIAADGTRRWDWEGPSVPSPYALSQSMGAVDVDADGISLYRLFVHEDLGPGALDQALISRVEADQLVSSLDLASALPGLPLAAAPLRHGDAWLVGTSMADAGGAVVASVGDDGEVEWLRHDPGTGGDVYSLAVAGDRILMVLDENDNDTEFEVRSYTLEGELRGGLVIDLEGIVQDTVSPHLLGPGAFALPDGTVVVQVFSFESSTMVGVRP